MTSTENKKKKKPLVQTLEEQQVQEPEQEAVGSLKYLTEHKIDEIIKKGKDRIKHAITISDIKLRKTKAEIIREMAQDMEKEGYPVNQICDRLTKALKGLVSDRHVQDSLDEKYKNQVKMAEALAQNHGRRNQFAEQEQLRKKDVKDITLEDIKVLNNLQKIKQVAKHQIQKADWWEQQAKQQSSQEHQQEVNNKELEKEFTAKCKAIWWIGDVTRHHCLITIRVKPYESKMEDRVKIVGPIVVTRVERLDETKKPKPLKMPMQKEKERIASEMILDRLKELGQ
ncbi:MAG: hypothetical protein M3P08_16515 [Thermoproteota archaeon]|nr:hypothetical protein [Thermoproteota archaeon]